jgi:trimeric autotransporter adhesin
MRCFQIPTALITRPSAEIRFSTTAVAKITPQGVPSLFRNITGSANTALGWEALSNNITGDSNTAIGFRANVTANMPVINATAIGNSALVDASNKVRIGNTVVTQVEVPVAVTVGSDKRFKNDISAGNVLGLDFIKKLRPVTYHFDTEKFTRFVTRGMPDSVRRHYLDQNFGPSSARLQHGFIAQEVEKAVNDLNGNFDGLHAPAGENGYYTLAYSTFVVPLVKAVQEQQQMIDDLKKEIDKLKQQNGNNGGQRLTGNPEAAVAASSTAAAGHITLADAPVPGIQQIVPNPFSKQTSISYYLPFSSGTARLQFTAPGGRIIKTVPVNTKGLALMQVSADELPAGVYTCSLIIDGKTADTKQMVKQ